LVLLKPVLDQHTAGIQHTAEMRLITSHHIEMTDAGLDGLCIREINVYHTTL